jgi:hypothetical protein
MMEKAASGAVSTEGAGDVTAGAGGGVTTDDGKGRENAEWRDLRARARKAEEERDAAQGALKAREQADALARGEHEKVIAQLNEELSRLRPEVEATRAANAARRETLLALLPEEHKPIAADLALDKLEGYVGLINKVSPPAPLPVRTGQPGGATGATTMLTPAEIAEGIRTGGSAWLRDNAARIPSTG